MIRVNLIPPEYIEREKQKATLGFVIASVGMVVAMFGLFSVTLVMKEKRLLEDKFRLEGEVAQLEEIAKQVDALEAKKRAIDAKNGVVVRLLNGRYDYPALMEALVECLPPNQAAITSISLNRQGPQFGISMGVTAAGIGSVISWLQRLEARPAFSAVNLGSINYAGNFVNFEMKMVYKLPE